MTHPDDEISICAWIKRLAQNGNPVYLNWTHSNPIREAEAIEVAGKLGVPKANLSFMGATDGNIRFEMAELLPKFQDLLDRVRPDRVACGAFEQGHLDHDATNWLVNRAFHGATSSRVARRDVRIGARIQVQECPLGALKQHALAAVDGVLNEWVSVAHIGPQTLRVGLIFF